MTPAQMADEVVMTLYSTLDTNTLLEMRAVGAVADQDWESGDDPLLRTTVTELNAALDREVQRRGGVA